MRIKTRWLALYTTDGGGWFRVFRVGFGWKDTTKHPLTFSERNGYKRHLMIGKWSFGCWRMPNAKAQAPGAAVCARSPAATGCASNDGSENNLQKNGSNAAGERDGL